MTCSVTAKAKEKEQIEKDFKAHPEIFGSIQAQHSFCIVQ